MERSHFFLRLWAIESNLLIKCRFWQRLKTSKWKRHFRAICQRNWHIHNRGVRNSGRLCIIQTHISHACSSVLQTRYGESKKTRCRLWTTSKWLQHPQYLDNGHFCLFSISDWNIKIRFHPNNWCDVAKHRTCTGLVEVYPRTRRNYIICNKRIHWSFQS